MKSQFIKIVVALGICGSLTASAMAAIEGNENKEWGLTAMDEEMTMEMESLETRLDEMDLLVDAMTNPDDTAFMADHQGGHKKLKAICKKVNLDEQQKAELKDLVFTFMKDMISEKAKLKISMLEYIKLVLDENAQLASAQAQSDAILANFQSLGEKSATFKNTVFFKVLTGEQRKPAFACALGIKKMINKKKLAKACAARRASNS